MALSEWQTMMSIFKPQVEPTSEEIDKINSFFFCRLLGNNKHSVPIAFAINANYNIPVKTQFRFAQDYSDNMQLPRLVKFINFQKDKISPDIEKILTNLERKYKITREQSQQYFDLMRATPEGQEQLGAIMEMYTEGIRKG
jgi:hypothetical protein